MGKAQTMKNLSYGISKPNDLMDKLIYDWSILSNLLEKMESDEKLNDEKILSFSIFNFIITLAVLSEWIKKYYKKCINENFMKAMAGDDTFFESFPEETLSWISEKSQITNPHYDIRKQIINCLNICHHTCNASKHFHWHRSSNISAIEKEPVVKNWYEYFFTEIGPGIYIEYNEMYYSIHQIKTILIQFYEGLIPHLERKISEISEV